MAARAWAPSGPLPAARLPRQDSDVRPEAAGAGEAGREAEAEGEPRSRSPSPPQRLVALRCPQPGPLVYGQGPGVGRDGGGNAAPPLH